MLATRGTIRQVNRIVHASLIANDIKRFYDYGLGREWNVSSRAGGNMNDLQVKWTTARDSAGQAYPFANHKMVSQKIQHHGWGNVLH